MTGLGYSVYVAPPKYFAVDDLPPGESRGMWSPTTSTLIFGSESAILIDPLLTINESQLLAEWAAASGKQVVTIFVTHAHGDHFFGAAAVLDRFPRARVIATPGVVGRMGAQWEPPRYESFWSPRFPNQIADRRVVAKPVLGGVIELEGELLRVIELGHTDTDATTALHVPSLELVVAGDSVYGDVHPHLAEAPGQRLDDWFAALDTLDRLEPQFLVAGHKREGNGDNPAQIDWTRCYLRDFMASAARARTHSDLYESMVELYPDRLNRGALWQSARAFLP